ncbi:MAG: hypothetical protein R8N23_16935 [Reichenbachiella sp.]|uniref:hypothetical protein n=1 Tax=Reichenbachiella sp. TaxID=2184521 RepID=UPI0029665B83|nr:hypothetical protein [Reichenbachiella sp.]MDW3211559.1 hypothetical protein [Reichenbachiella sp.]
MKIFFTTAFSIILFSSAFSQDKRFAEKPDIWMDGYAYLTSGEKKEGKIIYSFNSQSIQIKIGEAIKTYPAKDINRFIVQNSKGEKLEYVSMFIAHIVKGDIERLQFGKQVINESDQFLLVKHKNTKAAILANLSFDIENFYYEDAVVSENGYHYSGKREILVERICILDKRAIPYPILYRPVDKIHKYKANSSEYNISYNEKTNQYSSKKPKKIDKENPKYKLINKDFLQELDSKNYKKLEAYIKKNEVDIKTIEGLTLLIDYWAEI